MFDHNSCEGVAESGPVLITLPADGSEVMLILCNIAHLRSHKSPDGPPLTKTIDVINLARK